MSPVVERTTAYGRHRAVVQLPDGSMVEGWGHTEQAALRCLQARAAAWVACADCRRVNVRPAEARVAARALGRVVCCGCREESR